MDKKIKAELVFAFSQLTANQLKNIPEEILKEVSTDYDETVYNNFEQDVPFTRQELSEETMEILLKLFENIEEVEN